MFSDEKNKDIDQLLNEALQSQPGFQLSDNFADVISEKVSRKFAWQQYISEFLIYFVSFMGLVGVSTAIQFVFFDAQWQIWLQFIVNNIFVLGGIIFILIFVLFADRVLLRYFIYRASIQKE